MKTQSQHWLMLALGVWLLASPMRWAMPWTTRRWSIAGGVGAVLVVFKPAVPGAGDQPGGGNGQPTARHLPAAVAGLARLHRRRAPAVNELHAWAR